MGPPPNDQDTKRVGVEFGGAAWTCAASAAPVRPGCGWVPRRGPRRGGGCAELSDFRGHGRGSTMWVWLEHSSPRSGL